MGIKRLSAKLKDSLTNWYLKPLSIYLLICSSYIRALLLTRYCTSEALLKPQILQKQPKHRSHKQQSAITLITLVKYRGASAITLLLRLLSAEELQQSLLFFCYSVAFFFFFFSHLANVTPKMTSYGELKTACQLKGWEKARKKKKHR